MILFTQFIMPSIGRLSLTARDFADVSTPALVVHGTKDRSAPYGGGVDWARALLLLGAKEIDSDTFAETMSVIVKHRADMDVVAERVGLKLSAPADVS